MKSHEDTMKSHEITIKTTYDMYIYYYIIMINQIMYGVYQIMFFV